MYEINYNINESDYLTFCVSNFLDSRSGKRNLTIFRMLLPCICALALCAFIVFSQDLMLVIIEAVTLAIIAILWVVFSKRFIINSLMRNVKKLKREGNLPFSEKGTIIFAETFICDIGLQMDVRTPYSAVQKIRREGDMLYIYTDVVRAYLVPLTSFETEEEKQKFIDFVTENMQKTENQKCSCACQPQAD